MKRKSLWGYVISRMVINDKDPDRGLALFPDEGTISHLSVK